MKYKSHADDGILHFDSSVTSVGICGDDDFRVDYQNGLLRDST
jgi:hypothetical protein